MEKIDRLLKQWIPVNTIVRKQIRDAIVKAIEKAHVDGYEAAHDEVRAD
tara:strand:+ start:86 stop:232 length:147 start_codon:yes stop_codon:yes gene_type:complete